ncbi:acyltransferase [Streptomyces sp. I05A-00742]|uniref:acyltransferase family protein n=1 Tax=Streptomyces sp. I05A-00742 TaxID=2732853 RepID=UPI0014881964|nr:acyltransferase [Streptomyces sp. I05A-00742]
MRFARRGGLDGSPPAVRRPAPRLAVLDGLRLVAALMVVVFHYTALRGGWDQNPDDVFPHLRTFTRYGFVGVEVFFLISGFVICMSTWGRSLGDFVVSRVSRIYPAYWFAIFLTAGVITLWPQVRSVENLDVVLTNLTMVQEAFGVWDVDGVYWTLFIELKFYVLFAIVVATGVTYRKCVLFCGIWTVAAVVAPRSDSKLLQMWAMPLYTPYFVAGIAFYLMHRFKPTALLWGIVSMSLLIALHGMPKRVADNTTTSIPVWPARLIVVAAFVIMALIALGHFNRIQWRWLTTAGALTYPLYLVHQYIGMTVIHGLRTRVAPYPLVAGLIVVMLGLAWLINRCVERPVGKRLRRAMQKGMEEMRRNSAVPALRKPDPQNDLTTILQEPRTHHKPYEPAEQGRVGAGTADGG